jgi:hypothetical protein
LLAARFPTAVQPANTMAKQPSNQAALSLFINLCTCEKVTPAGMAVAPVPADCSMDSAGVEMHFIMNARSVAALFLAVLAPTVGVAQEAGVTSISAVAWLAGCWSARKGDAGSGEQWLPPAGGTMFGVSRTVKDGKTVEFEFMQLRLNAEGKLVFIALPSGQKETTFVATASSENSVTFENPQHDFPQRVSYRLQPDGRLIARVEGTRSGVLRGIEFSFDRVACEALAGQ